MNIDIKLHFSALVLLICGLLLIAVLVGAIIGLFKLMMATPALAPWILGVIVLGVLYSVALDVAKAHSK